MASSPTVSTSQGFNGHSVAAATRKFSKKEQGMSLTLSKGKKKNILKPFVPKSNPQTYIQSLASQ